MQLINSGVGVNILHVSSVLCGIEAASGGGGKWSEVEGSGGGGK